MTQILNKLKFNTAPSYYMHIDLNSCFATVEQQANPLLRNRPIAVAAYTTAKGIIIAPSVEAKRLGIKVGTRVFEAKQVCPDIVIVPPDTDKYRYIHHRLKELLNAYTDRVIPKSVDEFVLDFKGIPDFKRGLIDIGAEIKKRIKDEIGDYITVSIGISKNKFLAKTASNLKKPDGLEEINETNYIEVYSKLELMDLCGIARKTLPLLNSYNIHTVVDLFNTNAADLKNMFHAVTGYYWYFRLRGYEIENYKDVRRSFGHQYALPKPILGLSELTPILMKLVEKMGFRLRTSGYKTQGVNLYMIYKDNTLWHMSAKTKKIIFDSRDIYKEMLRLYLKSPQKEIKIIGVSCFNLRQAENLQLELFDNTKRHENLTTALDNINSRWGKFVVVPANMIGGEKYVPDRIGFGNV